MERVEALSIIMNMLNRAQTTEWEIGPSQEIADKEAEAQEVLYQMWIELGGVK